MGPSGIAIPSRSRRLGGMVETLEAVSSMEWVTTSAILARLNCTDDQFVWTTFCERFRYPLMAFCRRFGLSSADSEDVTQDVLLAFVDRYRQGAYQREKGRLSAWLFGIAYREIQNHRRRRGREAERRDPRGQYSSFWEAQPSSEEAAEVWDREWEQAILESCLKQVRHELQASTFRAFQLVVHEEKSPAEVARELGISRDAVYVAKHRVLKRLGELSRQFEALE